MNDELWNEICVQFQFLCQIITNSNEKLIDWFISHFLAIYVANNSVLLYASFREGTPRVKNLLFYPFPPCTLLALLHHVSFLALLIARWFEPVMVFPRVHGASLAIELPSGYLELLQPTLATKLLNTYILTLYFTETSAYMLLQLVQDETSMTYFSL